MSIDAVVHCRSERQARMVAQAIGERMGQVGLRLHPQKTRIVYCQDGTRRGSHEHVSFTYLAIHVPGAGPAHQARKGVHRVRPGDQQGCPEENQCRGAVLATAPAHPVTPSANSRGGSTPSRQARQYYGAFYRSALYPVLKRINGYLVRWLRKKYKRLKTFKKAHEAWGRPTSSTRRCFAQFEWVAAHWR